MAGKKSGLGRGLDALFPEKTVQSKPKIVKTVKEEKKVAVDTKKSSQQETSNGERMMKISMSEVRMHLMIFARQLYLKIRWHREKNC